MRSAGIFEADPVFTALKSAADFSRLAALVASQPGRADSPSAKDLTAEKKGSGERAELRPLC